ncbi:glycosyltransferase family 2 protein, partial [Mammaliicoccus sciuri]
MEVSVIIPIYNAEKTIEQTIKSIKSHYEHEIICINDGSKDNSADVISKINNPNIVLVNRENKGAAATRNEGISIAKGKYIMFCDADDKLGEGIIDKMVEAIKRNDTDIVVGKVSHLIGDQIRPIQTYNDLKAVDRTTLNLTPEVTQSIGPYGKLYKHEVLENIRFDEDITFCEEHTFNLKAWSKSRITILDDSAYLYNIGVEDSIVATSYKNIEKYLNDATEVRKRTMDILSDLKEKVSNYYSYR